MNSRLLNPYRPHNTRFVPPTRGPVDWNLSPPSYRGLFTIYDQLTLVLREHLRERDRIEKSIYNEFITEKIRDDTIGQFLESQDCNNRDTYIALYSQHSNWISVNCKIFSFEYTIHTGDVLPHPGASNPFIDLAQLLPPQLRPEPDDPDPNWEADFYWEITREPTAEDIDLQAINVLYTQKLQARSRSELLQLRSTVREIIDQTHTPTTTPRELLEELWSSSDEISSVDSEDH